MFVNKILPMEIIEDYCEFNIGGLRLIFVYCSNDVIFEFDGDLELVSFILN